MASFKFCFNPDIHQSQKSYHLPEFDQNLFFSFISSNHCRTISINNFTKVRQIQVSRLSKHLIHTSESDTIVKDEFISHNLIHNHQLRKNPRRNIWKRFHGVNKANKDATFSHSGSTQNRLESSGQTPFPPFVYSGQIHGELESLVLAVRLNSSLQNCNNLLKQLEKQGYGVETLSFFEWMRRNGKLKENLSAYNFCLRVLARKEDWEAVEILLLQVIATFGTQLSFQVFNTLIYACNKRGLSELGTKWFRLMLESGVRPNVATFGMLMSLYQKGGNVAEAEFAFNRMQGFELQCATAYSAMITIYTRLGLYEKAEEIIRMMKEDNVVLNLENWLVQLNAYSQQGKLEEADRVFTEMGKAGIPPNIVAYNTLITGYGKVSNMDAAESLLRNLCNIGLEPDETTYRSMVEGWGRAGCYEEAKRYYKKLKQSGFKPNSSNMHTMINLQAKHDDEEGVLETLQDMRGMGCQHSSMLSNLLRAYEKVDKIGKVPLILKGSMYEHVLVDQTSCSILVMSYVKHYLVDPALEVLQEKIWKNTAFEDNLYHLLICSCKESGHHEDAVKIFNDMPKLDANPNLHITCTMIDIYGLMGQFEEAKNLYLKLQSSMVAFDMVAYSIVFRMYVKSGSLKDACVVLDTMDRQKDVVPDKFLFCDMLRIYQRCGLQEKLADLYYKMLKSGIHWDGDMYNCIINCCAHALPVDELSRIFTEMLHRGFPPNTITFNVMLDVYGKARLFKKARKVFWIAQKRGLTDVISYNTIIAAYGKNKDMKKMQSTVRKMQFNGFTVSLEAYNCMLDAYGKERQMESFRSVLERMKESSCDADQYTYSIMINIYGELGWIEEVACVLTDLKEHGLQQNLCSYNSLIKAYGIAGMVEEAVAVVKEMREIGIEPDRVTYVNLVRALQRNDNFLEAVKWSLWMKQMGMSTAKY